MGIEDLISYSASREYFKSGVEIFGQRISFFNPDRKNLHGYENLDRIKEEATGVPNIATSYNAYSVKGFIDFTLRKSVMHHFNWFPEDADQVCVLVTSPQDLITIDSYIRTSVIESVSVWGDIVFSIRKIFDDGMYKILSRFYMLTPIVSKELNEVLLPERFKGAYTIL